MWTLPQQTYKHFLMKTSKNVQIFLHGNITSRQQRRNITLPDKFKESCNSGKYPLPTEQKSSHWLCSHQNRIVEQCILLHPKSHRVQDTIHRLKCYCLLAKYIPYFLLQKRMGTMAWYLRRKLCNGVRSWKLVYKAPETSGPCYSKTIEGILHRSHFFFFSFGVQCFSSFLHYLLDISNNPNFPRWFSKSIRILSLFSVCMQRRKDRWKRID